MHLNRGTKQPVFGPRCPVLSITGKPTETTIGLVLPNWSPKAVRCVVKWPASLTAAMPTTAKACRINVGPTWNVFRGVPFVTSIAKFFSNRLGRQNQDAAIQHAPWLRRGPSNRSRFQASLSRTGSLCSAGFVFAAVGLLAAPPCLPQTAGIPDAGNVGVPINGVFSGSNVDSVQLNNGDLHIDIPLLDIPGLGVPIRIHFIYDNKIWNYASNASADTYTVNQDRSPAFLSYPGNVYVSAATTTPIVNCGTQSYPDTFLTHLSFVDQEGTAHPFNVNGYVATSPPCDYAPAPTVMYAADSSGILGNRTPNEATLAKAITKTGTVYTFPAYTLPVTNDVVIEDSNGNTLNAVTSFNSAAKTQTTTITDTAGRVFTIVGESQYGYQPSSISYTDQNGATQTITISYTTLSVNTAPLCALETGFQCVPTVASSVDVPATITLPDDYVYKFTFQPNSLVDLESLTLPTGGVISWTYGQTDVSGDKVLTRTVAADGQTSVWKYNYAMSSNQGANTSNVVTVTDPFLNDTQYTCTIYAPNPLGLPSTAQLQPCYMTKEEAFTGSHSSGTPLVTKATAYNVTGVVLPKATTVTWASTGQVSETDTSWDSIPNSGYYTGTDNPANDVSRGNLLSRVDYDYGSGAHGALLRNTQYTYLYQENSAYVAPNIVDRVYQESVYNSLTASSGTLVAQTTTAYDQFNQSSINGQGALVSAAGTTNHDYTNFGTAATLRGLPTSVTKATGASSTAITTYIDYNDLGSATVATDGNRNSTTYSYGAENEFPSAVAQPATNGVNHTDSYDYDTKTGLLMSHTDQNKIVTKYTYDSLMRPLLVDNAIGTLNWLTNASAESKTAFNQSTNETDIDQDQTTTGDGALKSSTVLDGLGRPFKAVARDGSVIETAYDALNRVCAVSNPALAANTPSTLSCTVGQNKATAATDGYTYFTYDALGRKTVQMQPDSTTQRWGYTGNVVDFYDEDNSHWQWTSDALGRLTKAKENDPAGSGVLTLETDYTYNALSDLLSVNQIGASGDTARYRTFTYDSMSRLTNACNPEAIAGGGTCTAASGPWSEAYTYDANGNVIKRTDARGIVTNYTYDALNRLLGKTYTNDPANTPALTYGYDTEYSWQMIQDEDNPVGHLNSIMATLGTTNLVTWTSSDYDQRGNLTGYVNCLGSNAQSCPGFGVGTLLGYDLNEELTNDTENAGGATFNGQYDDITYGYDSSGRMNSIATYISIDTSGNSLASTAFSGLTYYPGGAVETAKLAINPTTQVAGIALSRSYNNRGRITGEVDTNSLSQSAYTYSVSYDGNGNATAYNDSVAGNWTVKNDSLHRFLSSTGTYNGGASSFQETYDHFGNRNVEYFTYKGVQNQPSPYLNFTAANNRVATWSYDNAGNLLNDGTNNYLYDAEDRLCAVQQVAASGDMIGYLYAPDGTRLGKGNLSSFSCDLTKNGMLTANGLALTNAYVVGPQGEQLEVTDGNFNFLHFNVYWESKPLGTFAGTTYAQSNWQFSLHDWLGTTRQVTNAAGTPAAAFFNGPFGDYQTKTGSGSDPSGLHFTGQERDTESGLDYFPARYYSSYLGRFLSPDYNELGGGADAVPYADFTNPQSLNLYAYVNNNPLTTADPDGHGCFDSDATSSVDSNGNLQVNGDCDWGGFIPTQEQVSEFVDQVKNTAQQAATQFSNIMNTPGGPGCMAGLAAGGAGAGAAAGGGVGLVGLAGGGVGVAVTEPAGLVAGGVGGGASGVALAMTICPGGAANGGGGGSSGSNARLTKPQQRQTAKYLGMKEVKGLRSQNQPVFEKDGRYFTFSNTSHAPGEVFKELDRNANRIATTDINFNRIGP
jgi:RHS repeat-associated protein